jgi:hypothetical protein
MRYKTVINRYVIKFDFAYTGVLLKSIINIALLI